MPRPTSTATTKIIHSVDHGEQLSRHKKALRKKIEETILLTAANEDIEIDPEEVKRRIFLEESSKKTYTVSKTEIDLITKFVWDLGLRGPGNKRMMEKLYNECELGPTAIARRDKISTKVHNAYRTYRETAEMFGDEMQLVNDLAERLFGLLKCFKDREGALEALEAYGIFIQGEEEG